MSPSEFIPIGKVSKSHGNKGSIVITIDLDQFDLLDQSEPVFIKIDGIPVPFFISPEPISYAKGGIRLFFDGIDSREKAQQLTGLEFLAHPKAISYLDPDDGLVGYHLVDPSIAFQATILEIIEYPNNEVFRLEVKGKEVLVPTNLALTIDHDSRTVRLRLPDGLLDLYLE